MRVGLPEAVGDHLVDEVVGDEGSLIDQGLGYFAEGGPIGDIGAEDVPGGDLRDAIFGHQRLGLGSFAYAWRA
jgi:hypothetical protein